MKHISGKEFQTMAKNHESGSEILLLFVINIFGFLFVSFYFLAPYKAFVILGGIFLVLVTGLILFVFTVAKMWQHEVHTIIESMGYTDPTQHHSA